MEVMWKKIQMKNQKMKMLKQKITKQFLIEFRMNFSQEWTNDVEKEFLRCYSILKKRDPKIYDSNTSFFHTPSSSDNPMETTKKKKPKKMNLKDAEIQYALAEARNHGEDEDHIQ